MTSSAPAPLVTLEVSRDASSPPHLFAVGDCFVPAARPGTEDPDLEAWLSSDLRSLSAESDLSIVNLECALSDRGAPLLKSGPHLHGSPRLPQALRDAGFDVANLANNHILDHGAESLAATVELCHGAGLETVGVGSSLEDAAQPRIVGCGDRTVALLAFAEQEFSVAGETAPGAAMLEPERVGPVIRRAREQADLVVVCCHGGNILHPSPSPRMQRWCRFIVDCGAHAVLGSHPHVVQGTELYRQAPIVYSMGNFLMPSRRERPGAWYRGLAVRLALGREGVERVELFGSRQTVDGRRVALVEEAGRAEFVAHLEALGVVAADPARVAAIWRCFCRDRRGHYARAFRASAGALRVGVKPLVGQGVREKRPQDLVAAFGELASGALRSGPARRGELTTLLSYFRCPSHRDVMTTLIEMELEGIEPDERSQLEYASLRDVWDRPDR